MAHESSITVVSEPVRPDASRKVAGLLAITAGLVLVILVWGAIVRLTGSGLSIPDWPLINGSLLPPFSDEGWKAVQEDYRSEALRIGNPAFPADISVATFRTQFWIEWAHRAIAGILGIVFLLAFIAMLRSPVVKEKVESNFYVLGGLLLAQAGLGGVVVKGDLAGTLVALHLVTAYIFFGILIWTALRLFDTEELPAGGSRSAGLQPLRAVWITIGLVIIQVLLGGLVAGDAKTNLVTTWPLMFGSFSPPFELLWNDQWQGLGNLLFNPILLQFVHRWMPLLLLLSFAMLRVVNAQTPLKPQTRIIFRTVDALFLFQIMIGITNVVFGAQTHVSALHSAVALSLFGALIVLAHDLRYQSGELALSIKTKSGSVVK